MDALEHMRIRQNFSNDLNNKNIPVGLLQNTQWKNMCCESHEGMYYFASESILASTIRLTKRKHNEIFNLVLIHAVFIIHAKRLNGPLYFLFVR